MSLRVSLHKDRDEEDQAGKGRGTVTKTATSDPPINGQALKAWAPQLLNEQLLLLLEGLTYRSSTGGIPSQCGQKQEAEHGNDPLNTTCPRLLGAWDELNSNQQKSTH